MRFLELLWAWLLFFLSATASTTMAAEPAPRQMVGGYAPVENADENPQVRNVAAFVLDALRSTITPPPEYTFLQELPVSPSREICDNLKIVQAFQQVVAGLNYRLVLALVAPNGVDCMGAFAVTVYDHFGDLSVTQWGKEIDCARAMAALENQDMKDAHADHFNG